jgi:replication factor C subunit 3/5
MDSKHNIPWIEKYRPSHFDDIVLDPFNKTLFSNILKHNYFPNLLFYGPPGTGKTTTILNLINEYQLRRNSTSNTSNTGNTNKENVIHLNASDERGIDIIRIQINQFVKTKNLFDAGYKFVILDEVDYMTKNAQQSLKTLLQLCKNNVRFCLICNYISKIDESLQNEFICVRFNQLPRSEIHRFVRIIADKEHIHLTDENIETIQAIYHSDIRSMINFIQLNHDVGNTAHTMGEEMSIITDKTWMHIYDLFMDSNRETVRNEVIHYIHGVSIKYNMDKRTLLNTFFMYLLRNKPDIISGKFLNIVENIVHISDDVPIESVLHYFYDSMMEYGLQL